MVGRGDDHGVDIFAIEQLAIVGVAFAPCTLAIVIQPLLINVAHGHAADVVAIGAADQVAHVPRAHAPHADHAKLDAVIRAQNLARGRRLQQTRPDRRRPLPQYPKPQSRDAKRRLGEPIADRAWEISPLVCGVGAAALTGGRFSISLEAREWPKKRNEACGTSCPSPAPLASKGEFGNEHAGGGPDRWASAPHFKAAWRRSKFHDRSPQAPFAQPAFADAPPRGYHFQPGRICSLTTQPSGHWPRDSLARHSAARQAIASADSSSSPPMCGARTTLSSFTSGLSKRQRFDFEYVQARARQMAAGKCLGQGVLVHQSAARPY